MYIFGVTASALITVSAKVSKTDEQRTYQFIHFQPCLQIDALINLGSALVPQLVGTTLSIIWKLQVMLWNQAG